MIFTTDAVLNIHERILIARTTYVQTYVHIHFIWNCCRLVFCEFVARINISSRCAIEKELFDIIVNYHRLDFIAFISKHLWAHRSSFRRCS